MFFVYVLSAERHITDTHVNLEAVKKRIANATRKQQTKVIEILYVQAAHWQIQ